MKTSTHKKRSLFFQLILVCLSPHLAFAANPLIVSSSGLTATAIQTSSTSSRWRLAGTERYTYRANEWLEYLLDFGSGGSWIFSLTATNQDAPLPAGYSFKIRVAVDGATQGYFSVPGSSTTYKTGSFRPLRLSGVHSIRFTWTNGVYKRGVYDANIRVKNVSFKPGGGDTTPPAGSISINSGAAYTNTASSTLNLSATDNSGTVSQMQFSNDGTSWSGPEAYAATKSWNLSPGDGQKTVSVKFKDNAGNWSQVYSDMITLDTLAPQITSTVPQEYFTFYENDSIGMSASVQDNDPSPLEYQFSIDNLIKQPWSAQTSYDWSATSGRHSLKIEVRDEGGQTSKEAEVYVYRIPVGLPLT